MLARLYSRQRAMTLLNTQHRDWHGIVTARHDWYCAGLEKRSFCALPAVLAPAGTDSKAIYKVVKTRLRHVHGHPHNAGVLFHPALHCVSSEMLLHGDLSQNVLSYLRSGNR
jgi:hypothetical protein